MAVQLGETLLSVTQAALIYEIPERTLRSWITLAQLRSETTARNRPRYMWQDIDTLVQSHATKPGV